MAQVDSNAGTKSGKSAAGGGNAGGTAAPPARKGILGFGRSLIDRTGGAGPAANGTKPKRGQTFQFFLGLIIFMLGSQVLLTVLNFVGSLLGIQAFLASTLAPPRQGVLLLSGLTWFELFWFALVALFYYVLIKTKLLPTDPWGTKARAREQAAGRAGGRATGNGKAGSAKSSPVPTVNVRPLTRADRRAAAQERAEREAAAAAKNTKRAKAGQSTATVAQATDAARSGEYDVEYERAKVQQRQMRRREAKR